MAAVRTVRSVLWLGCCCGGAAHVHTAPRVSKRRHLQTQKKKKKEHHVHVDCVTLTAACCHGSSPPLEKKMLLPVGVAPPNFSRTLAEPSLGFTASPKMAWHWLTQYVRLTFCVKSIRFMQGSKVQCE